MSAVSNLIPKDSAVVTPSGTSLSNVVGLYAGTAGVASIVTRKGTAHDVTLLAGGSYVCALDKVTAWTGTAGTLVALKDA